MYVTYTHKRVKTIMVENITGSTEQQSGYLRKYEKDKRFEMIFVKSLEKIY